MTFRRICLILLVIGPALVTRSQDTPRVFLVDPVALAANKALWLSGNRELERAVTRLKKDANKALATPQLSVVTKDAVPPSGDRHDYMSMGKYWWPDSTKPGGLPYVRRDGVVNPEVAKITDDEYLSKVIKSVATLSLAYFYSGNESYAAHAAQLVRAWFLEPATKMNPNLDFAQAVPGRNDGRGAGIIDTHLLPELLDGIGLIRTSAAWREEDQQGMAEWCTDYLRWLIESKNGMAEARAKNNHGTWYDVQVVALQLFLGRPDSAHQVLRTRSTKRIATQIEPDGSQPEELARTKSWDYSFFNLSGMFALASLADRVGVDLWNYRTEDGRGIRKAVDWLLPFILNEREWRHTQIAAQKTTGLYALFLKASVQFRDQRYGAAAKRLQGKSAGGDRVLLTLSHKR
jgi:hypothetical protein